MIRGVLVIAAALTLSACAFPATKMEPVGQTQIQARSPAAGDKVRK
jgi:hypothetical protein